MTSTYSLTKVFCTGSRHFPISRKISDVRIFDKVLLKSIEYSWAQKALLIPVSITAGKSMGHTSTNTKKCIANILLPILFYSILTTLVLAILFNLN